MQTVIETPEFLRRAKECRITDYERAAMIDLIASDPLAGEEIQGTGGARKLRFARTGIGKSGGYRVITFYSGKEIPVFLLSMFSKKEKSDLSQDEKKQLRSLLKVLPELYRRRTSK